MKIYATIKTDIENPHLDERVQVRESILDLLSFGNSKWVHCILVDGDPKIYMIRKGSLVDWSIEEMDR